MMSYWTRGVLAAVAVMALGTVVMAGPVEDSKNGPYGNIKVTAVAAQWEYSNDGGKTFSKQPLGGAQAGKSLPFVIRGTFEIANPADVAVLWVRIAEEGDAPKASICSGDKVAAGGGYYKNNGFCPTLLNAQVTLNCKPVPEPQWAIQAFWWPVTDGFQAGKNTIELRGDMYTYYNMGPAKAIEARLIAAEPQPANIFNGPMLGDFGPGYFTVTCRTQLQADLTVEAQPTEPNAPAVSASSTKKLWHRVKVKVPEGTKTLSYTLISKVGRHMTQRGPFTLRLPDTQKDFRFIAFGNVSAGSRSIPAWTENSKAMLGLKPAFLLNTGNPMDICTWEFDWERKYVAPAADLLASTPLLITPCDKDFTAPFFELHYTPAEDSYGQTWSKAFGPVRIIGVDGNQRWLPGQDNYKWLENELKNASEKWVVVLHGYPGYSSGKTSNKLRFHQQQSREVILPLLGKYKASVMLCSWDPDYERCEPTPDKGCTQIVTGAMGQWAFGWSSGANLNPFGEGKGHEWVGHGFTRHCCVFDVKGDNLDMQVLSLPGYKELDKKTFKPRNVK